MLFFISSCRKDEPSSNSSALDPNVDIENLKVSDNFEFRTSDEVIIQINDPKFNRVKYTVYASYGQEKRKPLTWGITTSILGRNLQVLATKIGIKTILVIEIPETL